ncbi:MAG: pyridoxamine 5'-phosphate oxidase family protein [Tropicimonas sp.]|uniref:pyridoxamine 5'-phosphate oxidase family protein n=1 Tax=Tropicimonas sp. TaxID=2067044 RepID=UPI003A8B97F5
MTLDPRIADFLSRNCVMSLATADAARPWAASVFYAFDAARVALVFVTETRTRHGTELARNPQVAATIAAQNSNVAELEGVQLEGRAFRPEHPDREIALFQVRFPIARERPAPVWLLEPERIKFTCNPLGFGVKLHWDRQAGSSG